MAARISLEESDAVPKNLREKLEALEEKRASEQMEMNEFSEKKKTNEFSRLKIESYEKEREIPRMNKEFYEKENLPQLKLSSMGISNEIAFSKVVFQ